MGRLSSTPILENLMIENKNATLELTVEVVAAFLANNAVPQAALPDLIRSVDKTFAALGDETATPAAAANQKPAVPVSRSIQEDYIVCLEDGAKLKMLKRYLRARYDMTPEDYRRKWKLPADYPMVAPAYSAKRSQFAKTIGLGKAMRTRGGKT
jgi:predicted transcriptional regulator